jgi:hypothetical protein
MLDNAYGMTFGKTFAQSSIKGALTRAGVAWVLITPAVAAAKIWWSATGALIVGLAGVGIYVAVATRYQRRNRSRDAR